MQGAWLGKHECVLTSVPDTLFPWAPSIWLPCPIHYSFPGLVVALMSSVAHLVCMPRCLHSSRLVVFFFFFRSMLQATFGVCNLLQHVLCVVSVCVERVLLTVLVAARSASTMNTCNCRPTRYSCQSYKKREGSPTPPYAA